MADSQITGVFCGRCGLAVPDNRDPCRDCGSTSRRYDVSLSEQLDLEATLDLVHDSPASETKPHTIGSFKGYGLQSVASLDKHGVVRLRVQGLPDVGTRGEPDVMNLLQAALKADGSPLQLAPGALDSRGEDGLLVSGKQRFSLQVTAVPQANSFWRDAARGSGSTEVSKEMAVEWIREAVMK